MIKLLKFQLRNLCTQTFVYICSILTLLSTLLALFIMDSNGLVLIRSDLCKLTNLNIITVIFICFFMCLDSVNHTTKNIVAKGYSKIKLFFSKFIVVILYVAAIIIAQVVLMLVFSLFSSKIAISGTEFIYFAKNFLYYLPLISLYVAMSTIADKNGLSIALCIIVDTSVTLVLSIISALIASHTGRTITLLDYWVSSIRNLSTCPQIVASVGYTVLFIVLSIFVVNKREIK